MFRINFGTSKYYTITYVLIDSKTDRKLLET
jgi:hypothetical protein